MNTLQVVLWVHQLPKPWLVLREVRRLLTPAGQLAQLAKSQCCIVLIIETRHMMVLATLVW
jgi:hypothetical protein